MLELTLGCRTDGRAITTAGRENPHIFADGISGAGKSFELKRLAEDAVCQGAQVIAFDYTGDFAAYMPPEGVLLRRMDVSSKELQINPLSPTSSAPASVQGQRLVNLLLAVINHLLYGLKEKLLQHGKGDDHITKGQQRSPKVHADQAFKSLHPASLLSFWYTGRHGFTKQTKSGMR